MRMDRMTSRLQGALADAQSLAAGRDHATLEPVHLLAVLLEPGPGTLLPLLVQAGGRSEAIADGVSAALDRVATLSTPTGDIQASRDFTRAMTLASGMSQKAGDRFLSSEQVLLALARDRAVQQVLVGAGVGPAQLERAVAAARDGETVDDANAEEHRQALGRYSIDLTERPNRASSIPSSAGTTKSGAPFRCCNAAPRTTPC